MNALNAINNVIDDKIMDLHVAFLARVLSVSGNTATVQPLNMVKQYGRSAKKQSVLPNVPILSNAKYKLRESSITYLTNPSGATATTEIAKLAYIAKGDIVFCVCGDRDITEARRGNIAVPVVGRHHNMSDAVIVGIL